MYYSFCSFTKVNYGEIRKNNWHNGLTKMARFKYFKSGFIIFFPLVMTLYYILTQTSPLGYYGPSIFQPIWYQLLRQSCNIQCLYR